jgi:hypothetical protein
VGRGIRHAVEGRGIPRHHNDHKFRNLGRRLMNIAYRVAKVAALLFMTVALAVFVSCNLAGDQGGEGATGKDGSQGPAGKDGSQGPAAPAAPIPLTGRTVLALLDSQNAGDGEDEVKEIVIDLVADGYFHGGKADFTFTVVPDDETNWETFDIDDDTNKLKLKLDPPGGGYQSVHYMDGFFVTVTAIDANREKATSTVTVKPNRAPSLVDANSDSDGVLQSPNDAYVIGIMPGEIDADTGTDGMQPRTDGAASCSMFNECELELFQDDGDYTITVTSDEKGKYSWDADQGMLTLTGLAPTWDEEADPAAADAPVMVKVKAEDGDGLSLEVSFMLSVNAPPTLSENAEALVKSVEITVGTEPTSLITAEGAALLFKDVEDDTVVASFGSSNDSVVTITAAGVMAPVSRGTATITITGTTGMEDDDEGGLGQKETLDIAVQVN